MKRRKLPLDSANWITLNEAMLLAFKVAGQITDFSLLPSKTNLIVADLQAGLEDEDIGSKAKWLTSSSRTTQRLLSCDDWREHYEISRERPQVVARRGSLDPTAVLFVWRPDIERIFPSGQVASVGQSTADISAATTQPEQSVTHGTRSGKKKYDWVPIEIEIMRRVVETLPRGPDSDRQIARDVGDWFKEKHRKRGPSESLMREAVKGIVAGMRALLTQLT
jgi:hypothetical protein